MFVMDEPTALHFPLSYPLSEVDHQALETLCADKQKLKDLGGPRERDLPHVFDDHGLLLYDGKDFHAEEE